MKNNPLITVLMPVYNTPEEYLCPAIESILNQTFQNFIFMIIDDGSTTNVKKVIQSYKDKRIVYLRNQKNMGLIKTLNKGLDLIKTQYIARMDSDDIALPDRLQKQITYMQENPDIDILGSGVEFFPKYQLWQPVQNPTWIDFSQGCPIAHPTVVFRTKALKKYNLHYDEDYPYAEDYALWVRAFALMKIENMQSVLLKYRWHETNISNSKKNEQAKTVYKIQSELCEKLGMQPINCTKQIKRFLGLPFIYIKWKEKKISLYLFGIIKFLTIKRI